MKIKHAVMTIKRVQHQKIVVCEDAGYDMPTNANELISLNNDMRDDPMSFDQGTWGLGEITIESIAFVEDES